MEIDLSKLSKKQIKVLEEIRTKGSWKVSNCQHPTVKILEGLGICQFNSSFTALIFTEAGKKLSL